MQADVTKWVGTGASDAADMSRMHASDCESSFPTPGLLVSDNLAVLKIVV